MSKVLEYVLRVVMLYLPAMIANAIPLICRRYVFRNPHPIDLKKNFYDGRRLFGDNKSIEGFIVGVIAGALIGLAYGYYMPSRISEWISYGFLSGVGAMSGDLLNSFIKRRIGMKPGQPFIPLDQISFIIGASVLIKLTRADLAINQELSFVDLLVGLLLAGILHPLTNYIAYLVGIKEMPL
ncbi:MAG: CDP-2,3-bis-(O-geranylgeranyl)-sn-glycerol synthase [Desulfurococcaceae archaeon TW002]